MNKFRPTIRKYKRGDQTDSIAIAQKMTALDKAPQPFWVIALMGKIIGCGRNKHECHNAPEVVASGQMTYRQWEIATETACKKEFS